MQNASMTTENTESEVGQTLDRLGKKNGVKVMAAINGEGAFLKVQPHHNLDRDMAGQLVELAAKLTTSICNNIKLYSETEKAYFLRVRMKEWEI